MTACSAIGALLLAIIYAPLFHIHDGDEHEGPASFVHAHFPELHVEEAGQTFDHPPEGNPRSIDVLVIAAPYSLPGLFFAVEEPFVLQAPRACSGFATVDEPRAHAPPSLISQIPRSPPV
jgi:hypothetical protein